MQEYLYSTTSNDDQRRDLLREIDGGELDEQYLTRPARPKPIAKPVITVSRSSTQ
jgi:hypothetical protein